MHKIAGARAEEGGTLEEVKAVAEKVIANVRTMGMAIQPCTVPAAGVSIIAKKPDQNGKAITMAAMVETYAVIALLVSILSIFSISGLNI